MIECVKLKSENGWLGAQLEYTYGT